MKREFLLVLAVMLLLASAAFAENEKIEKSWQEELFGTELLNAQGQTVSSASLNDKIVAIYFSAHWCPPCREFTPQLVQFCNELKAQQKAFEIVLISYDRDEESMRNYMTETKMPWLAIPYKSAKRTDVMKWFQVNQIPTLFVLNAKGQLISTKAREEVTEKGTKIFDAWEKAEVTSKDLWYEKYFGKTLTNARGEKIATDILRGKLVGIYHSASWCGPCRNFTPELVKFHNAQKKLHNNFEIVLLCEDETKEAMQAYMKEDKMAWLAMPFDRASIQQAWAKIADVAKVDWGIPSLIIFGPDGRLISTSGRKEVIEQGDNIFKVWSAKAKEESK